MYGYLSKKNPPHTLLLEICKALVSAAQLSGAQILTGERWARAHSKITERERKLALISALKMSPFLSILRKNIPVNRKNLNSTFHWKYQFW